jgi:hypothetical protein
MRGSRRMLGDWAYWALFVTAVLSAGIALYIALGTKIERNGRCTSLRRDRERLGIPATYFGREVHRGNGQ